MDEISRKRLDILRFSLALEKIASYLLGLIFDREDFKETKSFGNQSTALSFNQKMNLLLDYRTIEKQDKIKLDAVMNIRNQFLHNVDCTSYRDAFKAINGLENSFKKLYPIIFANGVTEESLEKGINQAFVDCIDIFQEAKNKGNLSNKLRVEAERKVYKQIIDTVRENAITKVAVLKVEIENDQFDYRDKAKLVDKLFDLINDVFDLSKLKKNEIKAHD